jgi:release factor glutamine methyltransferase
LALKDERPDLDVVGIDVSSDAIAVARANAARLGLDVEFVIGDLLDAEFGDLLEAEFADLPAGSTAFDAVLANLPYVPDGAVLPPEISVYEPVEALFAGLDGLDAIRRLIEMSGPLGFLALEIGIDQADAVSRLLAGAGFTSVVRHRDLAGIDRVIVGRR